MTTTQANTGEAFAAGIPGVYADVPAELYHSLDACSATQLKSARQSMAHCRYDMDHPRFGPTLLLGEATHCMTLQPGLFAEAFCCAEQCEGTTGKGQRCSKGGSARIGGKWFCGIHADGNADTVKILTPDQWQAAVAMTASIRRHDYALRLINSRGGDELSLLWVDGETGLRCKARLDKHAEKYQTVADIKTATDASTPEFTKAIFNYGYAIQAAHYLAGAEACGLGADTFAFIAVENTPPHCCAVFQLEPEAVEIGWRQRQRLMEKYAECKLTGVWPGYDPEPQMIGLPRWAMNEGTL